MLFASFMSLCFGCLFRNVTLPHQLTTVNIFFAEDPICYSLFIFRTGKINVPEWTDLVKLAKFNVLAPTDEDWFFIRAG